MTFLRFPYEVWETIIGKMDYPKDALNTFNAYPELGEEGVLKNERDLWLSIKVIPHLFPWLNPTEVLSCRLVCRKWKMALDNALENHPFRRAPGNHSDDDNFKIDNEQQWKPKIYRSQYSFLEHFRGLKVFTSSVMMDNFIRDMGYYSSKGSPLPGRYIHISDFHLPGLDYDSLREFWNRAMDFLRLFGAHVWFLELSYNFGGNVDRFVRQVLKIVRCVPNLKGFKIRTSDFCYGGGLIDGLELPEARDETFPQLLQLETLELDNEVIPQRLVDILLTHYPRGVSRLKMFYQSWRPDFANRLQNLTELSLRQCRRHHEVTDILPSLEAPQLARLRIILPFTSTLVIDENMLSWFSSFPKLHSLELCIRNMRMEDGISSPDKPLISIPSLKSLTLNNISTHSNDAEVDWKFLSCFPHLEYFRTSGYGLRCSSIYDSGIWEGLPFLNEVVVEGMPGTTRGILRYSRAKFHELKQ